MGSTTALVRKPVLDAIEKGKENLVNRLPAGIDPQRFYLGIMTAIQKNPTLLNCDPSSVLLAAYDAAEQGCSLSPSLQMGWLIPYGREAQFQSSYRFFVQRAYETGDVRSFFAEVVYKGDKFTRQFAPKRSLIHEPGDGERTKDARLGAYAFIEFMDGSIEWQYLTNEQIERHRNKSKQPNSMKWTDFWEEGFKITAIRVLAKMLPLKSRKLELLVETVNKDTERDLDTPVTGVIELEPTSTLAQGIPSQLTAMPTDQYLGRAGSPIVSYTVGRETTVIDGNVTKLASDLKKLHAKPEGKSWHIPAAMTQEFVDLAEKRGVTITEIQLTEQPKEAMPEENQSQANFNPFEKEDAPGLYPD